MNKRNISIDTLRCILAFSVVLLHVGMPGRFFWLIEPFVRCAVPMFFMITGFCIYDRSNQNEYKPVLKNACKNLKLGVIAWSVYFVWRTALAVAGGYSLVEFFNNSFSPSALVRFFLFNKPEVGDYTWFLFALSYVLFVFAFFQRIEKKEKVLWWIIPGACGYLILGKYAFLVFGRELSYWYARNFLFDGLTYFALGCLISKSKKKIESRPEKVWIILSGLYYGLILAEKMLLITNGVYIKSHHYLFATPFIVCFFSWFVKHDEVAKKTILPRIGKDHSLNIYIFHLYILDFIRIGLEKKVHINTLIQYFLPMIVFILALFLSILWNRVIDKIKPHCTGKL